MTMNQPCLRLGLPSGSLQESTLDLFAKAGYQITGSKRSYKPAIDDPELEVRLLRAQEISRYVEHGFLDCGITGKDWIEENNSDVELIGKLQYSKSTSSPTRVGSGRADEFLSPISQGLGRKAHRNRSGRLDDPLSELQRCASQSGIQLGFNRGESSRTGRRHRRDH